MDAWKQDNVRLHLLGLISAFSRVKSKACPKCDCENSLYYIDGILSCWRCGFRICESTVLDLREVSLNAISQLRAFPDEASDIVVKLTDLVSELLSGHRLGLKFPPINRTLKMRPKKIKLNNC